MVAVQVRQGTVGVDGRGSGLAGNTGRGWSRFRSGREHWAWIVAVEVRQGTLDANGRGCKREAGRRRTEEEEGGGGAEEASNIKSHVDAKQPERPRSEHNIGFALPSVAPGTEPNRSQGVLVT